MNSLLQALNTKFHMPEFLIILLDDDLIEFLQYKKIGAASLLGPWIEYLAEVVSTSLNQRRDDLSIKAKLPEQTQFYWVEPVNHENFEHGNRQIRDVFRQCLEVNCKLYENMRILKICEFWDRKDDNLVMNNRLTKQGLSAYRHALDASFKFNVKKREEFLIRENFRALKSKALAANSGLNNRRKWNYKNLVREEQDKQLRNESNYAKMHGNDHDILRIGPREIAEFFRHQRKNLQFDRFHWSRNKSQGNSSSYFN